MRDLVVHLYVTGGRVHSVMTMWIVSAIGRARSRRVEVEGVVLLPESGGLGSNPGSSLDRIGVAVN